MQMKYENNLDLGFLFLKRSEFEPQQKPALVLIKKDGSRITYTWEHFEEEAVTIAEGLKENGVKPGDFVAILPLNLPESFFAMWGIILAGAVPVPIHVQLVKQKDQTDIKRILEDCKPKLVLANECLSQFIPDIEHIPIEAISVSGDVARYSKKLSLDVIHANDNLDRPRVKPDDLLVMPYTSGTSGNPKGVMLSHRNIFERLEAVNTELGTRSDERILSYLPLGHISELIATFFGQVYRGYTVFFTEHIIDTLADRESFKKNFPLVLQEVKPTVFLGVPKVWINFRKEIENRMNKLPVPARLIPSFLKRKLVKKGLGFTNARLFINAGAKLSREDWRFFNDLIGIRILDIYGLTETAGPLTIDGKVIGSGSLVGVENGEIIVSGDCVMRGYFQNPEASAQALIPNMCLGTERLGWYSYHTGDTGVTRGGRIFCEGRIDDDFKLANGEKINAGPREALEEEIRKIDPRITEVIICGENRPHLIALVFCEKCLAENGLNGKVGQALSGIGEGMLRIKNFALINNSQLELTPTLKVKRKVMLKKLESVISSLYL